jgi:hypothetical protein
MEKSLLEHGLEILASSESPTEEQEAVDFMEEVDDLFKDIPIVLHSPPVPIFVEGPVEQTEERKRIVSYTPVRGDKDCSGKVDASSVPSAVIALLARIYEYGSRKYRPGSWRLGFPDSELASAMERHYLLWRAGEDLDKESGEPHLGHLAWGSLTLWMQQALGSGARDLDLDPKEAALVRDLLYGHPVTAKKFSPPESVQDAR